MLGKKITGLADYRQTLQPVMCLYVNRIGGREVIFTVTLTALNERSTIVSHLLNLCVGQTSRVSIRKASSQKLCMKQILNEEGI